MYRFAATRRWRQTSCMIFFASKSDGGFTPCAKRFGVGLPMSPYRQFTSYVNLDTTEVKLRRILQDFPVTTLGNMLGNYPQLADTHVV